MQRTTSNKLHTIFDAQANWKILSQVFVSFIYVFAYITSRHVTSFNMACMRLIRILVDYMITITLPFESQYSFIYALNSNTYYSRNVRVILFHCNENVTEKGKLI